MATSSRLTRETSDFLVAKNRAERFVLDVLAAPGFDPGCAESLSDVMKNLRIIEIRDEWALVLVDLTTHGWLRWKDNDGRFAISIDNPFEPQKD